MDWNVIALMFICVAMNHMGLIGAIEQEIDHPLPVINCIKCSSFWLTLIYGLYSKNGFITSAAMAFLLSYFAVWLELLMAFIDSIYIRLYGKIISTAGTDTTAADASNGDPDYAVSELPSGGNNRQ